MAALLLLVAAPAVAQSEAEAAAQNMGLAVDLCLQDLPDRDGLREGLIPRFQAAGFTIHANDGWTEVTAPGVAAYLSPREAESCSVQSPLVPMARAAQIAQDRVNYRFPGGAPVSAAPENRAGCPILRYNAAGMARLRMAIWSAGNGGGCEDPASSAILFGGF